MTTRVVNLRQNPFDIYIGRAGKGQSGKWGNPFSIGRDGTHDEVIAKHAKWILTQSQLMTDIHTLKGKTLGCFCKPKTCHGDTLAKLADQT